ncbi:MAG: DNA topoisomerase VI subunit B [Candidatus Micrarchaeaceae archaeon]
MPTNSEVIFQEFKEHSISEFFKKNKQMLGYSSKLRSLVTIVHEYVTNSLDACEEAGILPTLFITISKMDEEKYTVEVSDNGPGIPKKYIGKALAMILAGTKFHRNIQQRGQQGIGAAGCTLFAQVTSGRPISVISSTQNEAYSCNIGIDTLQNKPIITDMQNLPVPTSTGLYIKGEFNYVKYDTGDHSVKEYLKRTALSNPHAEIHFKDPEGKEQIFTRAVNELPKRPSVAKLHPLGLIANDLIEFAHSSSEKTLSNFFMNTFARFSKAKVDELKSILVGINFDNAPKDLTWDDAEKIVNAFKNIKWIIPDASHIIPIGENQIYIALKNILDPEYISVIERKPKVFKGGFPFIVEAAIAYGGQAGKKNEEGSEGNILRFANRVPLLFDSGNCAITEAIKSIQWKRYGIDLNNMPISILVNVSSVHIPYAGVGKESIAFEDEIEDEIKLAVMDSARNLQHFLIGKERTKTYANKYKFIMKYADQLSTDLSQLSNNDPEAIKAKLKEIVENKYKQSNEEETQNVNNFPSNSNI